MALTTKEAQILLNVKRQNSNILFDEEYKGDKEKHRFVCKICLHSWISTPNTLKREDNIGCPKCHKLHMGIKMEKKKPSKIKGEAKLLKNSTIPAYDVQVPQNKVSELKNIQVEINRIQKAIQSKKINLSHLKDIHCIDEKKLHEFKDTKKNLGCLPIILFPIWILYELEFAHKVKPFKEKEKNSAKNISDEEYEIKRLEGNIDRLEILCRSLEKDIKYETNISRLKNRITIRLGGKTRLYYFRLGIEGKKYYKIGITINSVEDRYRNEDGTDYRAIEEIYFDTFVHNAKKIEKLIIHTFKNKLANDKNILRVKGGYSEVFTTDILGLDKNEDRVIDTLRAVEKPKNNHEITENTFEHVEENDETKLIGVTRNISSGEYFIYLEGDIEANDMVINPLGRKIPFIAELFKDPEYINFDTLLSNNLINDEQINEFKKSKNLEHYRDKIEKEERVNQWGRP